MTTLGPPWLPMAVLLFGLGMSVSQQVWLRPLGLVETRWVLASLFAVGFLALLTPNVWAAAFLLTSALSLPVCLWGFRTNRLQEIVDPSYAAIVLVQLGVWLVATSLLVQSVRAHPEFLVAGLLAAATYTNVVAFLQVYCGLGISYRIAYGLRGAIVNEPVGCLHTVWRPAVINALLLPVAIGLAAEFPRWEIVLPIALAILGMLWHLWRSWTTTAILGAIAGVVGLAFAMGYYWSLVITSPLMLVAYPVLRRGIQGDPRWEIWAQLWSRVKADRFLGRGMGAWSGARVRGLVEADRVWIWAHSEWLEALYDTGPLPVLVAVGFLVEATWIAGGGLCPLRAGVYGGLLALAVVAAGYMPFRTWPVNLVGIGLLAAWLA